MTYTTTAAAHLADVTVDTIRVWARMGAIRATKQARRWVIDAASLAYRISLGIRRTAKGFKPSPDNHLHGSIDAGLYDTPDHLGERDQLGYRRAITVIAEKEAGTWGDPKKAKKATCYYCGVPITRRDGECEDCGSQTAVAKWLA